MAQPILCDGCEQAAADLLIHDVHSGDVQGYCLSCAPGMLRVMADVMTPRKDEPAVETPQDAVTGHPEVPDAEQPAPAFRDAPEVKGEAPRPNGASKAREAVTAPADGG